jgi:hypothetical protein
MKVLIAFLIAVLLIMLLKLVRLGLKRLQNLYSGNKSLDNILVIMEFLIWLGFTFWLIFFIFRNKFYYSFLVYALILIIAIFVSWFILKDIFAGIILRIKHNLSDGSYIKAGNYSGQIKSQRLTYMKIITADNRLLRIPYTNLVNEVIFETAVRGPAEEYILNIKIDISGGRSEAENLIRSALLNSPWSNVSEDPGLKFQKQDETGYFYEITFLSKNLKEIKNIEKSLGQVPSIKVL